MPARLAPPTCTAVSSAPQTLPFAYITCCIRESFAFRLAVGPPKLALLWVAMPAIAVLQLGIMTVSPTQSDSGRLPAGCVARGGTAYVSTGTSERNMLADGDVVFNEEVFVIDHRRMELLVPSSENTALELRKYSVPPLSVLNWFPGLTAGQTVKPPPSGPAPKVLKSTTLPLLPPSSRLLPMP